MVQDFALSHLMARPSMDDVKDRNLILFPEAAEVARAYVRNQPMNLSSWWVRTAPKSLRRISRQVKCG